MTIWKFPLAVEDIQTITLPFDARIPCVQVQHGIPCLWALLSPEAPCLKPCHIVTIGTGHQLDVAPGYYIGTYQLREGSLVFHVFEAQP